MYIKVLFGGLPGEEQVDADVTVPTEVLVNPDCSIRLIYEFLRETFLIPEKYELDLCDDSGTLCFINEKEAWMNGLNVFVPKSHYYLVLFEKDEDNKVSNPLLYLPEATKTSSNAQKSSAHWNDIMGKIRKQLNPSFTKPSRMSKTRINSSHTKLS